MVLKGGIINLVDNYASSLFNWSANEMRWRGGLLSPSVASCDLLPLRALSFPFDASFFYLDFGLLKEPMTVVIGLP